MSRGLRGVRDDLSEIVRRLIGAACFIAPLMAVSTDDDDDDDGGDVSPSTEPRLMEGAMNDLADFGGELKGGIARISNALNWRLGDGDSGSRVGIRKEIVKFVRDLAKSAEYWTEFPVPVDDHFDMSSHQRDHIAMVERMVPSLATLRITLCPRFMNEDTFWKTYFALLHPKLNEVESELLSTHQIVEEMRKNLKKKMQSRVTSESLNPASRSSIDTKHDMVHENQENNLQNRMHGESQNPVFESSFLMMIENPETESPCSLVSEKPGTVTESSETNASTQTEPQMSNKGSCSYIEAEDGDDIVKISPTLDAMDQYYARSLHDWLELREKPVPVDHDGVSKQFLGKGMRNDSSEWLAVEGISDFEIVERS